VKKLVSLTTTLFIFAGCSILPKPDIPTLMSPLDGELVIHPTFVWSAKGDLFELQFSTDSTFTTTESVQLADTTVIPTDSLEPGTYFWRVRSNEGSWGDWSVVFEFTVLAPVELLSPADADTVKLPALVWCSSGSVDNYHLYVYQGQPEAGYLVLSETLSDTVYTFTDTLEPATHYWKIEVNGISSDYSRFVTYHLEESYFPAGPGYEWEYMNISYGLPAHGNYWADTTYSTVSVTSIEGTEDSLIVKFSNKSDPVIYRNDSVFNGHYWYVEGRGTKLFFEEEDSITHWGANMKIHWLSDTTFRYGYGSNWDFGEIYIEYEDLGKGIGSVLIETCHGHRYHTEPEYSYYNGGKTVFVELTKSD